MWDTVEQCMKDGTLWALRDRKPGSSLANGASMEQPIAVKKGFKSKKSRSLGKVGRKRINLWQKSRKILAMMAFAKNDLGSTNGRRDSMSPIAARS